MHKVRWVFPIRNLILTEDWHLQVSPLRNLQKGTVTCVNPAPGLTAAEKGQHGAPVQPEGAHEVAPSGVERISSLHRVYMDVQGYFWARMHLKRKNKHLLSREELKHCTHMVIISYYF